MDAGAGSRRRKSLLATTTVVGCLILPMFHMHRTATFATIIENSASNGIAEPALIRMSLLPVRVGLCGEDFARVYESLLPHLFPPDRYDVTTVETKGGVVADGGPDVDFLSCLGYFYSRNLTDHRARIGDTYKRLNPPARSNATETETDGVHWPKIVDLVPHRERPFQLSFSHEAWDRGNCRFDAMIVATKEFHFTGCPLIFWADFASSFFRRNDPVGLLPKLIRPPNFDASPIQRSKTKFCAFIVGYCWHERYENNDIMVRVIFHDLLVELHNNEVSSFGRCRNTEGHSLGPKVTSPKQWNDLDKIVEVYQPFKFSIVFENNAVPGYVTEKILNGALAETIPIYWGAPDVGEYINLDRIVHCNLEGTPALEEFRRLPRPKNNSHSEEIIQRGKVLLKTAMQPCLDEVITLDQNPDLYARKLSQPLLPNNRIEGSHFDLKIIADSVRSVLAAYNSSLIV